MAHPGHPYSDPLELALQRELQTRERVLWKGRPQSRISWMSFGIYLFAVPWTAFSLFWTMMAYTGIESMKPADAGIIAYAFPLFGVPFILIGLGMLASPFLPLLRADKTLFAVTDSRIIELRLGRKQLATNSVPAGRLGSIKRRENRDGSGWLNISVGSRLDSDGDRITDQIVIGQVAEVMQAETIIRRVLEKMRDRPATAE